MLQFTCVTNYTCQILLLLSREAIILSKYLYCRHLVAYHSVNMVDEKCFALPHYLLPLTVPCTDKQCNKNNIVMFNFVF